MIGRFIEDLISLRYHCKGQQTVCMLARESSGPSQLTYRTLFYFGLKCQNRSSFPLQSRRVCSEACSGTCPLRVGLKMAPTALAVLLWMLSKGRLPMAVNENPCHRYLATCRAQLTFVAAVSTDTSHTVPRSAPLSCGRAFRHSVTSLVVL